MKKLCDLYPEVFKKIVLYKKEGKEVTSTYIHNGEIMVYFVDKNPYFKGYSLKIIDQNTEWEYYDES